MNPEVEKILSLQDIEFMLDYVSGSVVDEDDKTLFRSMRNCMYEWGHPLPAVELLILQRYFEHFWDKDHELF